MHPYGDDHLRTASCDRRAAGFRGRIVTRAAQNRWLVNGSSSDRDSTPCSLSGRGPVIRRSDSSIRASSMLASRRGISPFYANSHSSLPQPRHHWPVLSRRSYWNRTAIRSPSNAHRFVRSA